MKLTQDNYYSMDADLEYWSASQVKDFLSCPARGMATIKREYMRPDSAALLMGGFVDAVFSGTLREYCEEHPEMLKRDGNLKADYVKARTMAERAARDPVFMSFMDGDKQHIQTGTIGGLQFKGKFDVYKPGECIVDLKTVRDLKPVYKPGQGRVTFADAWEWPLQMAIYQRLEGNGLPCYLAVITKEEPPNIEIVHIPQETLDAEMELLEEKLPYLDAVKQGVIEPERCEDCAYCRATKKITAPRELEEFNDIGGIAID